MTSEKLYPRPCSLALLQGGGGKAPQQTASQKQAERLQMKLMQAQLNASQRTMEMPAIAIPEPAPPPPPPPAQTSADVINAEQETRRQALKRKGITSTFLAGNTGGYKPGALGGGPSLLGA